MSKYSEYLADKLLSLRELKPSFTGDRKWIHMRCAFCGDSKYDRNKTRLYIKVGVEDGEIPIFYCHNCGVCGPIDKALPVLFPNDYEIESQTSLYYKHAKLNPKSKKFALTRKKKIVIKAPLAKQYNLEKIQYINNRLGIKLNMRDIIKYKIVIDLYQFLAENNIQSLTRDKRICDKFETDYVGFLTVNNEYINLRNFRDSYNNDKYLKRYENYNIFDLADNTRRYYIIANEIDIMKDVEIHIAEGPFDILGVYNHIHNKDDKNKIYAAVCGSGYENVIKYIITEYGVLFNTIHIYSDNEPEKNISFYKKIQRNLGDRIGEMRVYYNKLSKDFGVRKEQIDYYYTIV